MDRNTIIGLVIIGVLLFGWTWYGGKQEEKRREIAREQFVKDSIANPGRYMITEGGAADDRRAVQQEYQRLQKEEQDRLRSAQIESLGESLVASQSGTENVYVLENDVMKVYVSSKGASVTNVELKDYKPYGKESDLKMFVDNTAAFDLTFFIRTLRDASISTSEYYFTSQQPQEIVAEGNIPGTLSMRLPVDPESGAYLEYIYTIRPGEYMIDFDVRFVGMRDMTATLPYFSIDWKMTTYQNEKGFKNENNYTTIAYRHPGVKKVEQLGMSEGSKKGKENTKVEWLNFKQQFFSSIFMAEDSFSDAEFGYNTYKPGSGRVKDYSANFMVPYYPNQDTYKFHFYYGPNHYRTLKQYDQKFEKVIPLGGNMISWINTGFYIPIMNWLSSKGLGYGLIILILTILVKIIILPLTYKSYMSSAKMKALKPELDELGERYPKQEDAVKKNQAQMALYKKYGVSPMGGCLPMLIQFPILIALFRFFPASIELRGERFLWADDLSAYDSVIDLPFKIPMYGDHVSLFALLMAITMYFYSRVNYKQTAAQQPQMAGMKFMMLYMMPIMMLLLLNNYASGLSYYYTVSQLATIGIMAGFKFFTDENKLRAKMEAKAKTIAAAPEKKKSGFQQRYEEAMRQQQAAQRQQQTGGSPKTHTAKPQSTNRQPAKKRKK